MNSESEVPRDEVEVLSWNAYGVWVYDAKVDTCAICRTSLNEPCLACSSRFGTSTEDDVECPLSWGSCNHAFHSHCISKWLNSNNTCPLDNQIWSLKA